MKSIHAGPAQSDQVVAPRPGSIETIARGREFSSASSADSAASERAQTPVSSLLGRGVVRCWGAPHPLVFFFVGGVFCSVFRFSPWAGVLVGWRGPRFFLGAGPK